MILEERSLHLSVSLSLAVKRIRWIRWSLLNFKAKHSGVYMLPDTDLSWRNTIQLADLGILIHIQFSVPGPPSHRFIAHYKGWEGKNKDRETRCKECISHPHSIQEIIASCCPIKHSDLAKLQWFKGEWMYTLNAQPNCFHEHSEDLNMKTHLFISSVCVFIRSIPTQDSVNRWWALFISALAFTILHRQCPQDGSLKEPFYYKCWVTILNSYWCPASWEDKGNSTLTVNSP